MAGINMSYYLYIPAQLEKIQNEPDYRKKVDFAVDAIMAIYNEEERLRHCQDSFRGKSYEYFQNIMISIFIVKMIILIELIILLKIIK